MDLDEITERFIKAQKNRDALEAQYKKAKADADRLNILRVKWAGICDYFQSLLPEKSESGETIPYRIEAMGKGKQN